jgi:hypothetical protein
LPTQPTSNRRHQSHRKQSAIPVDGRLLKFGSLPAAKDPDKPTSAELDAIRKAVAAYQAVFDTH